MPLFLALLLLPALELPTMPVTHVFIATDRAKTAAWLNVIFSAALFAAMVVPTLAGLPIVYVARALLLYGALRLAVCGYLFLRYFGGEREALPAGTAGDLLSYSIPLGVAQLIWKLNQVVDKYVVMYFLPMAVFAEYSVGSWEIPFVPMIANAVAAVMMPRFVAAYLEGRKKDLLDSWTEALNKVSIIVLPLMVLFVVIARELIVVLFTERYLNAVLPFQIYTLILFQRVTAYDAVLRAIDRTRMITLWALGTIVINVVLSVPLVIKLGMVGAALSTLIANVVMWFFVLAKIGEGLEVPLERVFPFRFYGLTLATAAAAGVPVMALPHALTVSAPVMLAAKIALYAASFAAAGSLTGVLGREERASAAALFRRGGDR
jgi:O-antigen/teichoic acid export membrane protein